MSNIESDSDFDSEDELPQTSWILPNHCPPTELLGSNFQVIDKIIKVTGSYIKYSAKKQVLYIWGTDEEIHEAKLILSQLWDIYKKSQETKEPSAMGTYVKELRKKEKDPSKVQRDKLKKQLLLKHSGMPLNPQKHQDSREIPDNFNAYKLFGEYLKKFDWIRVKYRVFIWFDAAKLLIHAAGSSFFNVNLAICYIEMDIEYVRLLNDLPPPINLVASSNDLSNDVIKIIDDPPENITMPQVPFKQFKFISKPNQLDKSPTPENKPEPEEQTLEELTNEGIDDYNSDHICDYLKNCLKPLKRHRGLVSLKMHLGHLFVISNHLSPMTKLSYSVDQFRSSLEDSSKLPTYFSNELKLDEDKYDDILAYFESHFSKSADSPSEEYFISCDINTISCDLESPLLVKCKFRNENQVPSLIETYHSVKTIGNCNLFQPDQKHDLQFKLTTSKYIPKSEEHNVDEFTESITLGKSHGVNFTNTLNIRVKKISQKTSYKFSSDDYQFGLVFSDEWTFESIHDSSEFNPMLSISQFQTHSKPTQHHAKVSINIENLDWPSTLSENCNLRISNSAKWKSKQLIHSPMVCDLMKFINLQIVQPMD